MLTPRPLCLRCRRPESVCYCAHLAPIDSRTRVVFLQHPRERRVAVGTCRMAHLALPNSELHVGVLFDKHQRVQALAREADVAVLFPGPGALDPRELEARPPRTLIVVDGTWIQARKVLDRNPVLRALPRIGLTPTRPGNYRIRKEPAAHCVSTIEAVVAVLGALEQADTKFEPMLKAFDHMVDRQLAFIASHEGPSRHRRRRHRQAQRAALRPALHEAVVVYAEANAHGKESQVPGPAELIQLVAERVPSGERFEAVIAPRRPLAQNVPHHLRLPALRLLSGEEVSSAIARFRAFLRPGETLCSWGGHAGQLLEEEGAPSSPYVELRPWATRVLRQRPGGIEPAAALLEAKVGAPWAEGRAGQRIAALAAVLRELSRRSPPPA